MRTVVLQGGWRTTKHAELALHDLAARLGVPVVAASTHFVEGAVLVQAEFGDVARGLTSLAADEVRDAVLAASGGRAFVFAGHDTHPGRVRVGDLVATTAIDDVIGINGAPIGPDTTIDTQGFLRPLYVGDRLVLTTRPAAGGIVVPFEQPNPTPCCADH